MAKKYSCYKCGETHTPMWYEKQIQELSGRSGGSFSYRLKADKSGSHGTRYNTGRNYYRIKNVLYCKRCRDAEQTVRIWVAVITLILMFAFVLWIKINQT